MNGLVTRIIATVVGGFILALLVAECREIRQTHDAVIRLESKQ
jgi:hypothetical protein